MREKRHAARRAARTAVTSRFVVLTGLSGSGKSQAIRALEDLGYFCVDNLPVTLLPMLAELTLRAGTEISRAAVDRNTMVALNDLGDVYLTFGGGSEPRQPDGTLVCSDTSPDGEEHPNGFEWCVNAPAVDARAIAAAAEALAQEAARG